MGKEERKRKSEKEVTDRDNVKEEYGSKERGLKMRHWKTLGNQQLVTRDVVQLHHYSVFFRSTFFTSSLSRLFNPSFSSVYLFHVYKFTTWLI